MIVIVLGTRPELIKTAPVIHELRARHVPLAIVHTGQHYSAALDDCFFDELDLPQPAANLRVGSAAAAEQLAQIVLRVAPVLAELRPAFVMVQGDTNSVLGGALAAHKLGLPIAHLEAGLRSDDWSMPEEGNRVLTGVMASVHLCPTELQATRLAQEGVRGGTYVVGNTVVDACLRYAEKAARVSTIVQRLSLTSRLALVTLHRPANVDDPARLGALLRTLLQVAERLGLHLVFPLHPRTRDRIEAAGLTPLLGAARWHAIEPIGYLDTLQLLRASSVVITDSGGLQEEACTLGVPCVTLRPNTERPETLAVGANVLCASAELEPVQRAITQQIDRVRDWINPLGDGHSASRVVDILTDPATPRSPSRAA